MDIPVLYQDDELVVINKPPRVVVNRSQTAKQETLQDWAEAYVHIRKPHLVSCKPQEHTLQHIGTYVKDADAEFYDRAGIVHRLDKETSGALIIAKTVPAFVALQRQFHDRIVKKTYIAIVHGLVCPEEGTVKAPIGRLAWNRERFGVIPGGRESVTSYKLIRTVTSPGGETLSVMDISPETGRTHQIRVHMAYIKHPVVGDYLYAGRKVSRDDRLWVPRVMLHAHGITFLIPATNRPISIEAPIPDDMEKVIKFDKSESS